MKVYDLDGTLSTANSTFDFIKLFHQENSNSLRLLCAEGVRRIMNRTKMDAEQKRTIMIRMYFFGLKKNTLEVFFDTTYLEYFKTTLTELGKEVLQQENHQSVMLTGCTSVPAEQLGQYFGFSETLSTTFHYKNNRVNKIEKDSYGNRKIPLIKEYIAQNHLTLTDVIYYTDDPESEDELIKLFGKTIIV